MAFEEVTKGAFIGKKAATNRVLIAFNKAGTIAIRVSNDVFTRVGSPMFFKVAVGTGQHEGLVALMPTNMKTASAYRVAVSHNGKGQASIGMSPKTISVKGSGNVEVPFEITDAGIAIDVRALRGPALVAAE